MNTRIQVEHPVTEMVTGTDIVKLQIKVAAGEKLGMNQGDVEIRGHAMECRINAEDPRHDFRPSAGTVAAFVPLGGPGVRVDTDAYAGYAIPPYYDSFLVEVIICGGDRDVA